MKTFSLASILGGNAALLWDAGTTSSISQSVSGLRVGMNREANDFSKKVGVRKGFIQYMKIESSATHEDPEDLYENKLKNAWNGLKSNQQQEFMEYVDETYSSIESAHKLFSLYGSEWRVWQQANHEKIQKQIVGLGAETESTRLSTGKLLSSDSSAELDLSFEMKKALLSDEEGSDPWVDDRWDDEDPPTSSETEKKSKAQSKIRKSKNLKEKMQKQPRHNQKKIPSQKVKESLVQQKVQQKKSRKTKQNQPRRNRNKIPSQKLKKCRVQQKKSRNNKKPKRHVNRYQRKLQERRKELQRLLQMTSKQRKEWRKKQQAKALTGLLHDFSSSEYSDDF